MSGPRDARKTTSRSRDLRGMLVIARRELLERVRSKWFVAITLLGPIGMVALVLLPVLLAGTGEGSRVDIIDRTGVLADRIAERLQIFKWHVEKVASTRTSEEELARIRDRKINGFLAIPEDGVRGGEILYRGDNGSSQAVQAILQSVLHDVVLTRRGEEAGLAKDMLAQLTRPVRFDPKQTSGTTEGSSGTATYLLGYLIAYIVLLVIMLYAVGVMRSVVQEKTSRVMELMVATVKPRSLMTGKILGVGLAGLLQFGVWIAMGALTLAYRNEIVAMFGKTATDVALPALAADQIAILLAFFILGYFFYASMYAAVGAMVSSEQDTQQVQMPIMLLLLVGFAFVQSVSSDPRGTTAVIVTLLPFWSALLMPMRYLLGGATFGEVALSLAILVVSTGLVARAAAKIYRVGVLMYGKRPGLQELIRWLRY